MLNAFAKRGTEGSGVRIGLTLYGYLDSGNGYKIRLLLAQLSRPYTYRELDITKGASRTPEFLRKNPHGRTPVLELEDGTCLAESNAILWYLAEGSAFLPSEPLPRAQVLQWMFFEQSSHEPFVATARFIVRHLPLDSPHTEVVEQRHALEVSVQCARILEAIDKPEAPAGFSDAQIPAAQYFDEQVRVSSKLALSCRDVPDSAFEPIGRVAAVLADRIVDSGHTGLLDVRQVPRRKGRVVGRCGIRPAWLPGCIDHHGMRVA
jgi:glutathione S-transferase